MPSISQLLRGVLLTLACSILLLLATTQKSAGVGLCGVAYTYKTPIDQVTSANLNANFVQAATTNSTPQCVEGNSATLTQMNATVNPFPGGAASLATTLEGELQRIRFTLTRMHGATNWYTDTQFSLGVGAGQLTRSSATLLQFCPYNGNMFRIPSTATPYQIPTACWTAANTSVYVGGVAATNLAASTTYWVYLFDLSGTPTFDFRTASTHTADSLTGIRIRTGDNTRALIGLIRTDSSSQFVNSATQRFVISWFNRRTIAGQNTFSTDRTTTSTTYVELNTEIRVEFVMWEEEAVFASAVGSTNNSGAAANSTAIGFDGTTAEAGFQTAGRSDTGLAVPIAISGYTSALTEGYHYATLLGAVAGGTGTWQGDTTITSETARVRLHVAVRG